MFAGVWKDSRSFRVITTRRLDLMREKVTSSMSDHFLDFNSFSTVPYRKITNKSPGLIEVRKHSLMGLYSGGGLFSEGPLG